MIKQRVNTLLGKLGYEIRRLEPVHQDNQARVPTTPPPLDPIWPLPRRSNRFSDDEIRQAFARYDSWHYAYRFDGGLSFSSHHTNPTMFTDVPERPLQRFRHFMPYLIQAQNGSLKGKRVLDIACNSGFWSIQCALLGAEVVGFDARPVLIEQANLVKSIVGVDNVSFKVLDFHDMSPQTLDGTFDVVLNLGILYHLPSPLDVLQRTKAMSRDVILLDTGVYRSSNPVIGLRWEEPSDIRMANVSGMVAAASKSGMDMLLRHIGVANWFEIPLRTRDMPPDYLDNSRASWLIKV